MASNEAIFLLEFIYNPSQLHIKHAKKERLLAPLTRVNLIYDSVKAIHLICNGILACIYAADAVLGCN